MVEGMSVVVNVMLSLMSVMSPVVWSPFVFLLGCLGTLCRCGDCDASTVVCVACVYAESVKVRG